MMRNHPHRVRGLLRATAILTLSLGATAQQPDSRTPGEQEPDRATVERLRRDQDEILRKAERLDKLMRRLMTRYQREGKQEQVDYLQAGIEHLERSGVLDEVASIRSDLETTAFTEAMRKQREVIAELEQLLDILLARKSVENIDDELDKVREQKLTASELSQRQSELMDRVEQITRSEPTPAEQALLDKFEQLRADEAREAERNRRDAGTRRPFLESALQRIQQLLGQQDRLEGALDDAGDGRDAGTEAEAFDLGALQQSVRELERSLRDQQQQQRLGTAGAALERAAAGDDPGSLQEARDELARGLDKAPPLPGGESDFDARDPEWAKLREQNRKADPSTAQGREQLGEIGREAQALAARRDSEANEHNQSGAAAARERAERLADSMAESSSGAEPGKRATDAVREAARKLAEAQQAATDQDTDTARRRVGEALHALDQARARHRDEHPDAARTAGQMAADARAAAQELKNAPQPEAAEQAAATELDTAADSLRELGEQLEATPGATPRERTSGASKQSRSALERARDALAEALGKSADKQALQAAAERQQQLTDAARDAGEQLQQAGQAGEVSQAQQQAAGQKLQQAQQAMQRAAEQLANGQQASAAQQQQQAADALQQAQQALAQNRPLDAQQRQQLGDAAKAQEQLSEDIIRLGKELDERDNERARRAVEEAADASRKAQRALQEGDAEEAQRQQQRARDNLEQATDDLQQEEDRYQDLRQEELLFRMKEELTSFLEKQRTITTQVKAFQEAAGGGRLPRAARRQVNGLAEQEQELAGRIDFLVQALQEDGNLVYQSVLRANLEDLREVARRLSGRAPDVGSFTTLLQDDVERRSQQLLEALEREIERKQQQQQQDQPQQGENKFNPQREKLVSLIAELEMLKQLGIDTRAATENLRKLVELRGDETISDAEVALIQRLHHRHSEITRLFEQIKAGLEQALQGDQEGGEGR